MKRLETALTKETNYFSRVLRAITTSVSSLLTWISMFISVGFAIIAVVILGVLLGAMVLICNYRNGTQYQAEVILRNLLTSLWKQSVEKTKKKWNSQKSSQASHPTAHQPPARMPTDISRKED
tara:strand:+ start:162 stop:530 length:369 start_codon:yes stop_codon:yes gene_type:complete